MNKQDRDDLRRYAEMETANKTHYELCHHIHGWCAVIRVLDWAEEGLESCGQCNRDIFRNGNGWKHKVDDGKICSAPSPASEAGLVVPMNQQRA
jgi:hypothetical protein